MKSPQIATQESHSRIHFRLTKDALFAANTGRPFTRRGLAAIVYSSITTKERARSGSRPSPPSLGPDAKLAMSNLRLLQAFFDP